MKDTNGDQFKNGLPRCAVIRPTAQGQIDAIGAAHALIDNGLFIGQSPAFTKVLLDLANAADSAVRKS